MTGQILYESLIELDDLLESTPNAPFTITPGTGQSDISGYGAFVNISKNAISRSLPYMLGVVQPLNAPEGFIYGLKSRGDTSVTDTANDNPDDAMIIRKKVITDVREIVMDTTNEVEQDISALFGSNFKDYLRDFLANGGIIYPNSDGDLLPSFVLAYLQSKIVSKTNADFTAWLSTEASIKGTASINTYDDMSRIFGIIGELREALYKQTHKISRPWILVTPRIAGFLSSTVGATQGNGATIWNEGRRIPSNLYNSYVMTMGDIDVYQYDYDGTVTGGSTGTTETSGRIYMGYLGGPDTSSIFYMPYKEYIINQPSTYLTGQSNYFYRIRDTWSTNPLDTYDKSIDSVIVDGSTNNPIGNNKSQYIVAADISFGESLIN